LVFQVLLETIFVHFLRGQDERPQLDLVLLVQGDGFEDHGHGEVRPTTRQVSSGSGDGGHVVGHLVLIFHIFGSCDCLDVRVDNMLANAKRFYDCVFVFAWEAPNPDPKHNMNRIASSRGRRPRTAFHQMTIAECYGVQQGASNL
jgi:hypothetical protein